MNQYKTFKVSIQNKVAHVTFNRPHKSNALNQQAWDDMKAIFEEIDLTPEIRAVVLSGEGKNFCAGIDLSLLMDISKMNAIKGEGRKREALRQSIIHYQATVTAIEKCRKPVLAAIHRACVGGAVDVITACDMRYCTEDAFFSIKEIDVGMVADVGTLQRLPKIINSGIVAELAYTGRKVSGTEATAIGLTNKTYATKEEMIAGVTAIAETIATKSPLSIRGTKEMLTYTRDHSVPEALNYMVAWNAAMLMSDDLMETFQAMKQKRKPIYKD